jgi:hypothetical protein
MKPRRIALVAWVLMGVLVKIFDVLTNIVANLLQDQLGACAWLIVIPSYSIIFFVLIVFDRWHRLQALLQDHQLAYDRRNRQAMIYTVRTSITKFLRDSL